MLTFTFRDGNYVVEPLVSVASVAPVDSVASVASVASVGDRDSLDGGAGCGARLRPLPIMPSDYAAVVPQLAGCLED